MSLICYFCYRFAEQEAASTASASNSYTVSRAAPVEVVQVAAAAPEPVTYYAPAPVAAPAQPSYIRYNF